MDCEQKHRLLSDYIERTQALAVAAELLLGTLEKNNEADWTDHWFRLEQARINCEIARLALSSYTTSRRF
ncbi:MAG TPA: hypothetical protein VG273_09740 [Bryobacteraceae bacterium]|jgi:hypothetical protein|nr:hypothetical protein [Bryobacteraceae bacterium]